MKIRDNLNSSSVVHLYNQKKINLSILFGNPVSGPQIKEEKKLENNDIVKSQKNEGENIAVVKSDTEQIESENNAFSKFSMQGNIENQVVPVKPLVSKFQHSQNDLIKKENNSLKLIENKNLANNNQEKPNNDNEEQNAPREKLDKNLIVVDPQSFSKAKLYNFDTIEDFDSHKSDNYIQYVFNDYCCCKIYNEKEAYLC